MQHSRPKVFFIGFNKTATTSLHRLFLDSGYISFHHTKRQNKKENIANIIDKNFKNNLPLLTNLETADCLIDMILSNNNRYLEANKYFRQLHQQYPDSYFILQIRNEENWIKSRLKHRSKPSFAKRSISALGLKNTDELIQFWKAMKSNHFTDVRNYFCNSKKFIEYNIDKDDISKLINFLSPHFQLKKEHWKKHNATTY
jgi:hypothetical protein